MSKRRSLLFLLLLVSTLLLAACAHQPHHQYVGVASTTPPATPPAPNSELEWDRTGSTANGTLTLSGGSNAAPGLAVAPNDQPVVVPGAPLPPGVYRLAISFTADTFAGVVSDTGGKEVAKATGTVTATGVDLTVTPPQTMPFTISFKSTKTGIYKESTES